MILKFWFDLKFLLFDICMFLNIVVCILILLMMMLLRNEGLLNLNIYVNFFGDK